MRVLDPDKLQTETLISFGEASAIPPGQTVETLYRWSDSGLKGIVLESVQTGGQRSTTREALHRFFTSLSQVKAAPRRTKGSE